MTHLTLFRACTTIAVVLLGSLPFARAAATSAATDGSPSYTGPIRTARKCRASVSSATSSASFPASSAKPKLRNGQ